VAGIGLQLERCQYFHAFILSTTDWGNSPDLDLPDGQISKHLNEVAIPKLKKTLEELQKTRLSSGF